MRFHIPFTFSKPDKLKKRAKFFLSKIKYKKDSKLSEYLKNCDVNITREEYLAISLRSLIFSFVFLLVISNTALVLLNVRSFYLLGTGIAILFSLFVLFSQTIYPKIYVGKRQRNIEKNLIPALENLLVQLNSGIPLFNALVNLSSATYGELSIEFKKAVKKINAGEPEEEVLEDLAKNNSSTFFRRSLWHISNGMKAGSDMAIVVKDNIRALNEEQLIQIQNYGNKLNPLIVFYMLVAVIIPALSITFLTILSSMINLEKNMAMMVFLGLFVFVILTQIMFLGIIKSRRPRLL